MLARAGRLVIKRICLHKGLPLGPVADFNHPRDVIKAARDFPDLDFVLYHAGLLTVPRGTDANVPWTTEFCRTKKREAALGNIYMELGSTFGQLATTNPTACAQCSASWSTPSGPITCCGAPTPSGTARPSGRSRRSAASRSRRR